MNVFSIVGKIETLPILKETPKGTKTCEVLLQVERPFANSEGIYETDHIQIEVWRGLAETLCSISKEDDLIAVKGRVASRMVQKDERTFYNYTFIAESVDFLQNKL